MHACSIREKTVRPGVNKITHTHGGNAERYIIIFIKKACRSAAITDIFEHTRLQLDPLKRRRVVFRSNFTACGAFDKA